jgi:hypothetical protein
MCNLIARNGQVRERERVTRGGQSDRSGNTIFHMRTWNQKDEVYIVEKIQRDEKKPLMIS